MNEQWKIGEHFAILNRLIALHERKYSKLMNVKKFMLEKMFPKDGAKVPALRFAGFSGEWEERKLEEIGTIVTGSTPSTDISEYYSSDGIPWVTPTDILENITYNTTKKLSDKGQKVGRIVPPNSILVTCIASIGKNTMLGTVGSCNQQINAIIPNTHEYFPYFLLTESHLWSACMKKSAAAGIMQIVNQKEFSDQKTMVPKLREQTQIGTFFATLDHLLSLHRQELERLQNVKKSCLEKMFA